MQDTKAETDQEVVLYVLMNSRIQVTKKRGRSPVS